jgi:TrpR-related protein YerC/YecD
MGKRRFTEDAYRKEPWFRGLCQALISCRTESDLADLLRDIGTLSELQAWSERLEVARGLALGKSYRQISDDTGASTATVTRVAWFIENGPGGYRRFLHTHRHHRLIQKAFNGPSIQEEPSEKGKESSTKMDHRHLEEQLRTEKPVSVLQKYLQKKEP